MSLTATSVITIDVVPGPTAWNFTMATLPPATPIRWPDTALRICTRSPVSETSAAKRALTPAPSAQLPSVPARTCSTSASNCMVKLTSLIPAFAPTVTTNSFISPTCSFCGAATVIGTATPIVAKGSTDIGTGGAIEIAGVDGMCRTRERVSPLAGGPAFALALPLATSTTRRRRAATRPQTPALQPARSRSSP